MASMEDFSEENGASVSNNAIPSLVREASHFSSRVATSLQSCLLSENRDILSKFINSYNPDQAKTKNLHALRYILDSLLAETENSKTLVYMTFDEAVSIYVGFKDNLDHAASEATRKAKTTRIQLRDLILNPTFALRVYLVDAIEGTIIVLRPDDIDLEPVLDRLTFQMLDNEEFGKAFLHEAVKSMDSEWDRKDLRVILGKTHTRAEMDRLGFDSDSMSKDLADVVNYFQSLEGAATEARDAVKNNLQEQITNTKSFVSSKRKLVMEKQHMWTKDQKETVEEDIEDAESKIKEWNSELLEQTEKPSFRGRVKRKTLSIMKQRRIKRRKLGSGRKMSMDEEDEKFLADCIAEKAAFHDRRKDSVLYTNHRVKKRDLLRIVNENHIRR